MTCLYYLLLTFLTGTAFFAQNATLRGQVTDESGGVIPGAKVTLTGPNGLVTTTTADSSGSYSFAGVQIRTTFRVSTGRPSRTCAIAPRSLDPST